MSDGAGAGAAGVEEEGAVRGGQLFGHLAGRGGGGGGGAGSAGSVGDGSGDDSDHFAGGGTSRADSGCGELAFGMELSGVSCPTKTFVLFVLAG